MGVSVPSSRSSLTTDGTFDIIDIGELSCFNPAIVIVFVLWFIVLAAVIFIFRKAPAQTIIF